MHYLKLGTTDTEISNVCLGTMTWGIQNDQKDADAQLGYAVNRGVNFIDTAELYPIPPNQQTQGRTEEILGHWLKRHRQLQDRLIVATKITGPGVGYIRGGDDISADAIPIALEASLRRLQLEQVDLYQLHWPNRSTPHFGRHAVNHICPSATDVEAELDSMARIVEAIGAQIKAGKINHWGLSDDTPWGIQTYCHLCDQLGVPRPVSLQNEFNLLHPKDWPFVIETCVFEGLSYLPWSPLAGGMLTGKYLNGARPTGTRWTLSQRQGLFRDTELAQQATAKYCDIATQYGLTPAQLALAWCAQVDGVASTIIGATSVSQLEENINAFDVVLSPECVSNVGACLQTYAQPF